jgi:hypothetical protein
MSYCLNIYLSVRNIYNFQKLIVKARMIYLNNHTTKLRIRTSIIIKYNCISFLQLTKKYIFSLK